MAGKRKKPAWKVTVQSVYSFGREERLQSAYEILLPEEKVQLKGKDDDTFKLVKIGFYTRVSSEKQAQEKTIDSQIATS